MELERGGCGRGGLSLIRDKFDLAFNDVNLRRDDAGRGQSAISWARAAPIFVERVSTSSTRLMRWCAQWLAPQPLWLPQHPACPV